MLLIRKEEECESKSHPTQKIEYLSTLIKCTLDFKTEIPKK